MNLSFKKRIATHFMLATALLTLFVFGTVYFIVQQTVYQNLDSDLSYESNKHKAEIDVTENQIKFYNKQEWEENEHKEVQVNPVFLQIVDTQGGLRDKSPNMKESQLSFKKDLNKESYFNAKLNGRSIRQVQIPLRQNGEIRAYIIAAMSLDATKAVLMNLRNTLFILFPIVLLILFFVTAYIAGRSIVPVISIIKTTDRISRSNMSERVTLPFRKDELYDLSASINNLLDRIEKNIKREKQFTSDASHELRTPLSVVRGTLEVLIRKPREEREYKEKIEFALNEIDRMSNMIGQLLEVARLENLSQIEAGERISITEVLDQILLRSKEEIESKNLQVSIEKTQIPVNSGINGFYGNVILENIISNAVKYSNSNGEIKIVLNEEGGILSCTVQDFGIGIAPGDLQDIYQPFFRSQATDHKHITGHGLGLSLVQKAASSISAEIHIESKLNYGTIVRVDFK